MGLGNLSGELTFHLGDDYRSSPSSLFSWSPDGKAKTLSTERKVFDLMFVTFGNKDGINNRGKMNEKD